MRKADFIIITGLSGAGKTSVLHILEDMGYFAADNIIPQVLPKFGEIFIRTAPQFPKAAFVVDVRGGIDNLRELPDYLLSLKKLGISYRLIFLDAADEVIVARFNETRREHPIKEGSTLKEKIAIERTALEPIRQIADMVIDTSNISLKELKGRVVELFGGGIHPFRVLITSFGFKYGIPSDVHLLFDVRFLPNPHYVERLRPKTGKDPDVREFLAKHVVTNRFLRMLKGMLDFLMPRYVEEGKSFLHIGIGCTGGRHRSVFVAEEVGSFLKSRGYEVSLFHRDMEKENG